MSKNKFLSFLRRNFSDKRLVGEETYRINYSDLYRVAKRELGADNSIFKEISDESKNKTYEISYKRTNIMFRGQPQYGLLVDNPDRDIQLIEREINKNKEEAPEPDSSLYLPLIIGGTVVGLLILGGIGYAVSTHDILPRKV